MIPNNNLSVLPWYTSIEQQNARKWWIYDRIYPLFTPAGFLLPFQLMREHLAQRDVLEYTQTNYDFFLLPDGTLDDESDSRVNTYSVEGFANIFFPRIDIADLQTQTLLAAFDAEDNLLGTWTPTQPGPTLENVIYTLPAGTSYVKIQVESRADIVIGEVRGGEYVTPVSSIVIYDAHTNAAVTGNVVSNFNDAGLAIKAFTQFGYDVIVSPGLVPAFTQFSNGQYYAVMSDGVNTWYSEVFTVVNDIQPYLKITWWDVEDFVMDAGTIVYTAPAFKNVLYLKADIAKPEYVFDEEGETRDGYFFPTKQISEKRYRFAFLASEYLLDVMRFIRMADFANVEYHGQTYSLDTFLITPEWEDNGDVAAVDAEFDTATVAKKIGGGYIKAQRGDFNDDFNNDFNNA